MFVQEKRNLAVLKSDCDNLTFSLPKTMSHGYLNAQIMLYVILFLAGYIDLLIPK
jgi:hypothetical protein